MMKKQLNLMGLILVMGATTCGYAQSMEEFNAHKPKKGTSHQTPCKGYAGEIALNVEEYTNSEITGELNGLAFNLGVQDERIPMLSGSELRLAAFYVPRYEYETIRIKEQRMLEAAGIYPEVIGENLRLEVMDCTNTVLKAIELELE